MSYNFNNDVPIYLQIIEHIKILIISNKYLPNEKIPSVRELSLEFNVNPNTIQKALAELENIGLITTERTNGKFVTNNLKIIKQITKETIDNKINEFLNSMKHMGIDKNEVLEILTKRYR
jgi:DNA-binding transcriptional regulator YhcF (GntR family)